MKCNVCGETKPIGEFSSKTRCKKCTSEYYKEYRTKNKDVFLKKQEREKERYAELKKIQAKGWYKKNKNRKKEYDKEYLAKNKIKIKKRRAEYYQKNKAKIKEKVRIYNNNKYQEDEQFNIRCRLRHRLREAFKRYSKNGKVGRSKDYDIDWQAIIQYIGPCPGNIEDYHIDHIIPLCKFNFDVLDEIQAAFSPENHQWLTKEENLKKSSN
jgi:hypothetical protein